MADPFDAFLDHDDSPILGDDSPTPDDESGLFALFAEALDPSNNKTIEEAEAEWKELLK